MYRVENNSVKQLEKLSMDVGWYIIMVNLHTEYDPHTRIVSPAATGSVF